MKLSQLKQGDKIIVKEDLNQTDFDFRSVMSGPGNWKTLKAGTQVEFIMLTSDTYGQWVTVRHDGHNYNVRPNKFR